MHFNHHVTVNLFRLLTPVVYKVFLLANIVIYIRGGKPFIVEIRKH